MSPPSPPPMHALPPPPPPRADPLAPAPPGHLLVAFAPVDHVIAIVAGHEVFARSSVERVLAAVGEGLYADGPGAGLQLIVARPAVENIAATPSRAGVLTRQA